MRAAPAVETPPVEQVALIIGAMKCGTTSLFEHLSEHPRICASARKEPMYFSRDAWERGADRYRSLWPDFDAAVHEVAIEASTEYTKWPDFPDVAPRIREFSERSGMRFKFIYIVRDPLAMIESGLGHGQDSGWSQGDRDRLLRHLLNVADFSAQLSRYRACFGRNDIHVLQLEKLVVDRARQLDGIARFLGLADGFSASGEAIRRNSAEARRRALSQKAFLEEVSRVAPLRPLWRLLPDAARDRMRPVAHRLIGGILPTRAAAPAGGWRLTDAERVEIVRRLRPGLDDLARDYRIDQTMWERTAATRI